MEQLINQCNYNIKDSESQCDQMFRFVFEYFAIFYIKHLPKQ